MILSINLKAAQIILSEFKDIENVPRINILQSYGNSLKVLIFTKNVTNYVNIGWKVSEYPHGCVSESFVQDLQPFGPTVMNM